MKLVPRGKVKHFETIGDGFNKTFQRNKALNLDHRNLLIFIIAEDFLPDIKD